MERLATLPNLMETEEQTTKAEEPSYNVYRSCRIQYKIMLWHIWAPGMTGKFIGKTSE